MPSFDIVSKVQMNEVDNALLQAQKELAQRFDFKDTETSVEKSEDGLVIKSSSEDRCKAAWKVLEDKLVKRKVSLKVLDYGKVEEAAKGHVRQTVKLTVGISADKAKEIGKFIKESAPKGVSHSVQGDQLRVQGKKRDDLQAAIAKLREHDFGIPLQFTNFRD